MEERAALLREAKRAAIVKELRDLRLSDPSVPLVSELDIDQPNDIPLLELDEADPEPLVGGEGMEEEEDQAIAGPSLSGTSYHMDQERPGPSGVNFEARIQRLEARLTSLERSHALLLKKCRSLQVAPAPVAPTSAQKGEHVDKLQNADFLITGGGLQTVPARGADQAKGPEQCQAVSHSLRFCRYMAQGVAADCLTRSVRFLNRLDHLRGYPTYLAQKGYKSTTIKNMMTNVIMFLRHVGKRFPRKTCLRPAEAKNIEYELQRIQRDIQREVLVHRQKILRKKSADQLDATDSVHFLARAKTAIGEILCREDPDEVHGLGMGYILAYLAIVTGHRAVVFHHTTKESVHNADSWKSGTRFQVLVPVLLVLVLVGGAGAGAVLVLVRLLLVPVLLVLVRLVRLVPVRLVPVVLRLVLVRLVLVLLVLVLLVLVRLVPVRLVLVLLVPVLLVPVLLVLVRLVLVRLVPVLLVLVRLVLVLLVLVLLVLVRLVPVRESWSVNVNALNTVTPARRQTAARSPEENTTGHITGNRVGERGHPGVCSRHGVSRGMTLLCSRAHSDYVS
uniref:Uncharacterized protein n=1 Tax=Knipowitschia caucasica TaxID=637954 RepID=A0AAV2JPX7_KNICA